MTCRHIILRFKKQVCSLSNQITKVSGNVGYSTAWHRALFFYMVTCAKISDKNESRSKRSFSFTKSTGGKNRATKYQKMFSTEQTEENILESSLAEDSYCVMKLSAGLQHSFFWGLIRADACHQFREFVLPVVTPAVEQSVRAGVYLASGYAKKYIFFLLATVILWAKALSQCSHILNTAQGRRILK